jgi:ABC-type sulfate transport system permease subunit
VSGPVFMFCAPGHVFDGKEGVGSRFQVLRVQTRIRRYRGRRVAFSCFALPDSFSAVPKASGPIFMFCAPDSFSAVPRASGPVFMFCAPGLVFGGAECGFNFVKINIITPN